jgi:predicted PurR-regulated permease PerM
MTLKPAHTPNSRLIERAMALLLVGVLGYACLKVVAPFLAPFIWGVILTLSTWPYYLKLVERLGGRRGLAATLLTMLMLLVFVVPVFFAFQAVQDHLPDLENLAAKIAELRTDEPPDWAAKVPLVGESLNAEWRSGKLKALLEPQKVRPVLATAAAWLLKEGASLALSGLYVILAVVMAGLLYVGGDKAAAVAERFALRIGGPDTVHALRVAANTVRGVSLGVIGTAAIQAILSGLGFAIADVPGAAILGLLCFLLAVMQVGTGLVWIPTAIWLAHQGHEGWSAFTVVWGIIINVMDNFIKPYFIGRTSPLPFLLIILGVIGGLLAWGFVGIFLGTTLLAVAYTIFFTWLDHEAPGGVETGAGAEPVSDTRVDRLT